MSSVPAGWRFPPTGNHFLREVLHAPLLTPEQCRQIVAALDEEAWEPGGVDRHDAAGGRTELEISSARRVRKQRVPDLEVGWPLDVIARSVVEANTSCYRFDLTGYSPADDPTVLRYDAPPTIDATGPGDGYDLHVDVGGVHTSTRKLSFSIQLTDPSTYEGGELYFPVGERVGSKDQGAIVVFPSYLAHGVQPMRSGTRHALVGWVHGPAFR